MKITWPQIPGNFAEESVNALTEAETKLSGLIEKELKCTRIRFSRWDKVEIASVSLFAITSLLSFLAKGLPAPILAAVRISALIFMGISLVFVHIEHNRAREFERVPRHPKRIEEYQDFKPKLCSTLNLIKQVRRAWEIHDVIEENRMNPKALKVETCIGESGVGTITFKKKECVKKSKDMESTWPGIYESIRLDRDLFYKVVKDDHIDFSELDKAFLDSAGEVRQQAAALNGSALNQTRLSDLSSKVSNQLIEADVIYL